MTKYFKEMLPYFTYSKKKKTLLKICLPVSVERIQKSLQFTDKIYYTSSYKRIIQLLLIAY